MSYTPRNPPANVNELSSFLAIELQKIAQEWSQPQPSVYLSTSYAEPPKPREGMIAKADGTTWNPGIGSGVYCYMSGVWVLLQSNGRETLTADRTYYVRTDGSDSNTGWVNTAGGAFLTIQKAADVAGLLDIGIYTVTLKVEDGSYSGAIALKTPIGTGIIALVGNITTPANCTLSATTGTTVYTVGVGSFSVSGFKISNTTGNAIQCLRGSTLYIDSVNFGACPNGSHISTLSSSYISISGNYTISGAALYHIYAVDQGQFSCISKTITTSGTPNFSGAFALSQTMGILLHNGCTFSGAATGKKYVSTMNGVIQTYGSGATYLPGSIAGTTATGGQYA